MAFFNLTLAQCDGWKCSLLLLEASSEQTLDINHVLSLSFPIWIKKELVVKLCRMWFSLLAVLLHCRNWRDNACKSTAKKVLAHILHYRENAIIALVFPFALSLNQTFLHRANLSSMCVIRSLVYRTCWRGEREGEQRCWLNNVKPVSLCAQFVGSAGYFPETTTIWRKKQAVWDLWPMSQHARVLTTSQR